MDLSGLTIGIRENVQCAFPIMNNGSSSGKKDTAVQECANHSA